MFQVLILTDVETEAQEVKSIVQRTVVKVRKWWNHSMRPGTSNL